MKRNTDKIYAGKIKEIASVFAQIQDEKIMSRPPIGYKIENEEIMSRFFEEIFTQAERKDISLRWELMRMLKKGVSQRKIATELGISLCKITRGAKILKDPRSVSNRMIKKLK